MENISNAPFWSSFTWLIICLVVFWALRMWDYQLSSRGLFYGLPYENNKLFRDKYKQFVAWKFHAGSVAFTAVTLLIYIFWKDAWVLAAAGDVFLAIVLPFYKQRQTKQRAEQIQFLQRARATYQAGQDVQLNHAFVLDRKYIMLFPYIYTYTANEDAAKAELDARFKAMALGPESNWFSIPPPAPRETDPLPQGIV